MTNQDIDANMKNEIIELSERKLERKLTDLEKKNIEKPRSLIGLEGIIDFVRENQLNPKEFEKYLSEL